MRKMLTSRRWIFPLQICFLTQFLLAGCSQASSVEIGSMEPRAAEPSMAGDSIRIDLEFLELIEKDSAWLQQELVAKEVDSGYTIEGRFLTTQSVEVARYVNRIQAFANLDPPLSYPYLRLELRDPAGNKAICATQWPRDVVPSLAVSDFGTDSFEVEDLSSEDIQKCAGDESTVQEYDSLDRSEFRQRYFGKSGELDIRNHRALSEDPDFILRAIELGYYAYQGDFTGYLQIHLDR